MYELVSLVSRFLRSFWLLTVMPKAGQELGNNGEVPLRLNVAVVSKECVCLHSRC